MTKLLGTKNVVYEKTVECANLTHHIAMKTTVCTSSIE